MYTYNFIEWAAFFFVYAFVGWIWEVLYVSATKRKLVNRGFLHMPILPIYGFGAIIMLHAALPFYNNPVMAFLAGMVSATLLELVTGLLMEKLFSVKYWDYSKQFLNYRGVICLSSSLFWGILTVVLIKFVHPFADELIASAKDRGGWIFTSAVIIFCAAFVFDTAVSVKEAVDLAAVIKHIDEAKADLKRKSDEAAKRFEEHKEHLAGRIEDKISGVKERSEARKSGLESRLSELRSKDFRVLRRNPSVSSRKYNEAVKEFKARFEVYKKTKKD